MIVPRLALNFLVRHWLLALALFIGFASVAYPYDASGDANLDRIFEAPSLARPLGSDWVGRSVIERAFVSIRAFFIPGILATLVTLGVGIPLGALAGYRRRHGRPEPWLDALRWVLGILLAVPGSLPRFVVIVLACAVWGFEPWIIAVTAGLLYAAELGEDLKTRVLACVAEEYIESAQADGLTDLRVLGYHIIYLQSRFLIYRHVADLWGFIVLTESALSFLPGGFGVQEPTPSLGNMLAGAADYVGRGHLLPAIVPTVCLLVVVVALAASSHRFKSHLEQSRGLG